MKKRIQINISLEDAEADIISEYCRVHDRTPQWVFKAGAKLLIDEDIRERTADSRTLRALREARQGLSKPIDDILEMLEEDEKTISESAPDHDADTEKVA